MYKYIYVYIHMHKRPTQETCTCVKKNIYTHIYIHSYKVWLLGLFRRELTADACFCEATVFTKVDYSFRMLPINVRCQISGGVYLIFSLITFSHEGRLWNFGVTHKIHKLFLTESTRSTWLGKEERDNAETVRTQLFWWTSTIWK